MVRFIDAYAAQRLASNFVAVASSDCSSSNGSNELWWMVKLCLIAYIVGPSHCCYRHDMNIAMCSITKK